MKVTIDKQDLDDLARALGASDGQTYSFEKLIARAEEMRAVRDLGLNEVAALRSARFNLRAHIASEQLATSLGYRIEVDDRVLETYVKEAVRRTKILIRHLETQP